MQRSQNKNWWGRNWKWFVPVGCLGAILFFVAFIALIFGLVFTSMKSSDAYKNALAKAQAHSEVQGAIGTPIEAGLLVSGNVSVNGPSGEANLSIPISGPDGEATLYVVAAKSAGQWTFSTLEAEIKATQQRIDLLE